MSADRPPRPPSHPAARRADLRLAPPALAAWAGAALTGPGGAALRVATIAAAVAIAGLGLRWSARGGSGTHRARWSHPVPVLLLTALALATVAGSVVIQDAVRHPAVLRDAMATRTAQVELRVDSPPSRATPGIDGGARVTFQATLTAIGPHGLRSPVRVLAPAESWELLVPGERVAAAAGLRETDPGGRATAFLIVSEPPQPRAPAPPAQALAAAVRANLRAAAAPLPGHAQLLPGIAVGDDDGVPDALADAMAATSLGHLLAVSGAHVAIVLGLVLTLAGSAATWLRLALGAGVLGGLVLLVGPEASVVRASAMGVVLLLALALGRRGQAMAALSAAVVVLLVLDPWLARSIGFALSVSATAGIVLGSAAATAALAPRLGRAGGLAPALGVPLAAQLGCLPVLLVVDPGVATYAVPANALVAPVVPPITLLGLGGAALGGPWPSGARALLWLATPGTWWIDQVASHLAAAPLARLPWPEGWRGLLLAGLVAGLAWFGRSWWHRTWRILLAFVLAAALVAVTVPATRDLVGSAIRPAWSPVSVLPQWHVVGCDVGQGTAVLVAVDPGGGGGQGAVMLDVGPPGAGVTACLAAAGVDRVAALVLSHADLDHVGALEEVLSTVPVDHAYLPAVADERLDDVRAALAAAGVAVTEVALPDESTAGARIVVPTAGPAPTLEVLWPTERAISVRGDIDATEANGLSLVALVRTAAVSVLAVGDLGAADQAALHRSQPMRTVLAEGGLDVVVVAHHGSPDADPAFLAEASGRVAILSVGADNRYGHPAPWVVAAIDDAGSLPLRTDSCGTISVRRTDEGVLEVSRCPAAA